jgi:hypothetical protein
MTFAIRDDFSQNYRMPGRLDGGDMYISYLSPVNQKVISRHNLQPSMMSHCDDPG